MFWEVVGAAVPAGAAFADAAPLGVFVASEENQLVVVVGMGAAAALALS